MKILRSIALSAILGTIAVISLSAGTIDAQAPTQTPAPNQVTVKFTPGQLNILTAVFHPWVKYFANPTYTFATPTKDAPQGLVNLTLTVTLNNSRPAHSRVTTTQSANATPTAIPLPLTSSFNVTLAFKPILKFGVLSWSLSNVTVNGQQPAAQQERTLLSLARYALLPAWVRSVRNGYYATLRGTRLIDVEITPELLTITAQGRAPKVTTKPVPIAIATPK
jgi:hypothetical protein